MSTFKKLKIVYLWHSYEFFVLDVVQIAVSIGEQENINHIEIVPIVIPSALTFYRVTLIRGIARRFARFAKNIYLRLSQTSHKNSSAKRINEDSLSMADLEKSVRLNSMKSNSFIINNITVTVAPCSLNSGFGQFILMAKCWICSLIRIGNLLTSVDKRNKAGTAAKTDILSHEDLLYSTQIRSAWRAGGDLYYACLHFSTILEYFYLKECSLDRLLDDKSSLLFSTALEQVYLDLLIPRRLTANGIKYIEIDTLDTSLRISLISPLYTHSLIPNPSINHRKILAEGSILWAKKYISQRLNGQKLDYMISNNNRTSIQIIYNKLKYLHGSCVVLFLHSFSDACYFNGLDYFSSIWDWSIKTIDILASVNSHVIIKLHPNVDTSTYPGDRIALTKLNVYIKKKLKNYTLIKDELSLLDLLSLTKLGITHHGSIAEELISLGIPCVTSNAAPWKNYRISNLHACSTLAEYCFVIKKFSKSAQNHRSLAIEDKCLYIDDSLAHFIEDYRFASSKNLRRHITLQTKDSLVAFLDKKNAYYNLSLGKFSRNSFIVIQSLLSFIYSTRNAQLRISYE